MQDAARSAEIIIDGPLPEGPEEGCSAARISQLETPSRVSCVRRSVRLSVMLATPRYASPCRALLSYATVDNITM